MTTFNLYANNYSRAYVNTYFDYLPKEIIDIIHEYNADHRPLYNKVLEELVELVEMRDACWRCRKIPSWGTKVYISTKRCLFCNSRCFVDSNNNRYKYFINTDISDRETVSILLRENIRENRFSRRMQHSNSKKV
jgi:hypothetical protein